MDWSGAWLWLDPHLRGAVGTVGAPLNRGLIVPRCCIGAGARPYGSVCDVVIAGPGLARPLRGAGQVLVPYPPCDMQ